MNFLTRQEDAGTHTLSVRAKPQMVPAPRADWDSTEKWPLWWTILGVSVICTSFWAVVFAWLL